MFPSFFGLFLPLSKGKTSRESEMLEKEFEKLHDLLYEEEEKLQRRLKGEKKATATKLRSNITQMMEQSQELELLIRKINRRCQQPPLGLLKVRTPLGLTPPASWRRHHHLPHPYLHK